MQKPKILLLIISAILLSGFIPLTSYSAPEKVYAADTGKTIKNISTMQEMTPEICTNTTIEDGVATLTDVRDGSTYTVAKLNDGKCWMTQNLRLTRESLIAKYKANNSIQSSDDSAIPASVYTLSPDTSDITKSSSPFILPISNEGGFTEENINSPKVAYDAEDETKLKAYGAYYNWNAATAGAGATSITTGNAPDSICPKGWRLPTGGDDGDFKTLGKDNGDGDFTPSEAYNRNDNANFTVYDTIYDGTSGRWFGSQTAGTDGAAFFPAAGVYGNSGILASLGSHGYYWSSTADSETYAYRLFFYNSGVGLAYSNNKLFGISVRCIARDHLEDRAAVNVVAVKVPPVIAIDAATGVEINVDPTKIYEGEFTATISANTPYKVLLSSNKPNLTKDGDEDHYIEASSNVAIGKSSWGIKDSDSTTDTDSATYTAITPQATELYSKRTYQESTTNWLHTFTVGISVASSLPVGEYSTTVTITAANI